MRKINSPGNVSNQFVDYDPVNNPLGTVYSADFGNDVQNDLIAIQEFAGLPQAAGSTSQVLKAILKINKEQSKFLGEHFYLDTLIAPSKFDGTDLDSAQEYFPALCLSNINIQTTISIDNWEFLVPHLRSMQIKYLEGLAGEVASFACTVSGSNVTFDNNTANNRLLVALAKWVLSHGSYTNWITLTIGGIEYPITNINTSTRVVTVTGSPASGSQTAQFFPHRISGSTTTARVYAATGKSLISPNDSAGLFINGMQMLGYFQGHRHTVFAMLSTGTDTANAAIYPTGYNTNITSSDPITDTVNGTPRTASETHSPSIVKHLYIFGKRYVA